MMHASRILSVYSSDTFGACSALFELGGMVVMHDPSGCNSTYTTHDEPRWYDMDSMLYISGLTERDAMLGNDGRLIRELAETVRQQRPAFLCLLGAPMSALPGTDLAAIARLVGRQTGIPAFALPTDGMHDYAHGISLALDALARHAIRQAASTERQGSASGRPAAASIRLNLLGATPLDFGMNGSTSSIRAWLEREGLEVIGTWAMESSLADIRRAAQADVNLVLSYGGLAAARRFRQECGIPYVVGVPFLPLQPRLLSLLRRAAQDKGTHILRPAARLTDGVRPAKSACVVGESVFSLSLAAALEQTWQLPVRIICPVRADASLLRPEDLRLSAETELSKALAAADIIVADPLYRPICPAASHFVPLPHMAFSGRLYQAEIPDLIASFPLTLENRPVQKGTSHP